MMLSRSSAYRDPQRPSWRQVLRSKLQAWVRQQIITDDPFDEDPLVAQRLYEELRQLEQAAVPIPFQSHAELRHRPRLQLQKQSQIDYKRL
ncbi:MAG: hypothetical protein MH252_13055 [Thermosynechococcaceae cyanobacterium MS004]|nr:hypothetical protein [Thermosynechococcaceae cyanobacterium MS004]